MKATAADIRPYFEPLLHTRPWKAKLGYGSFLTFEFGRRLKANGFVHGEWHLWIYQSNWSLMHDDRELANSDSDRRVISAAVRRLECSSLNEVKFDTERSTSTFSFDDFRLVVSPADYLDDADERDEFWLLFMPNKEVLSMGPGGVNVSLSNGGIAHVSSLTESRARKPRD